MAKIIIHYTNGQTYTIKCEELVEVVWEGEISEAGYEGPFITYIDFKGDVARVITQPIVDNTLAVEAHGKGGVAITTNPALKASVTTSVMTAKRRTQENNKAGGTRVEPKQYASKEAMREAVYGPDYAPLGKLVSVQHVTPAGAMTSTVTFTISTLRPVALYDAITMIAPIDNTRF